MTLRVPTNKAGAVGMRKLSDTNVVDSAIETLRGRARIKRTMWSRRAQEYEAKINSGDLISIAESESMKRQEMPSKIGSPLGRDDRVMVGQRHGLQVQRATHRIRIGARVVAVGSNGMQESGQAAGAGIVRYGQLSMPRRRQVGVDPGRVKRFDAKAAGRSFGQPGDRVVARGKLPLKQFGIG